MSRKAILILFLVAWLCGCTMAPVYSRPAAPIPSAWPTGPAYGKDGVLVTGLAAIEFPWEAFFHEEGLKKVIRLALANNRDLRITALNIEKARAQYRIQRAGLFPTVNASGDGTRQRLPADLSGLGEAVTNQQYSVSLGFSAWEIDLFGRIRSLKDQALEQYLATEQARRAAGISLVAEVAGAWLTLAADRENLHLARLTLEAQQVSYDLIRRRCEAGASSDLDLRLAQTRVEAARADIARYTGQVALDENALNLLVGSPVSPDLLPGRLADRADFPEIGAGLSSGVLLQRPDILQAENRLKAANANIGAARAAFFPRITLTTVFGTASDQLSGLFKAGSEAWTFSPQIQIPIFDMGSRRAGLKVAQAERDIAVAEYEKAIQVAFREVADALSGRSSMRDQFTAQQALMEATDESHRLSSARYDKGIDSYLTVLDTQRSLYAARQALIVVRLARMTNAVTLYKVLGGGE